MSENSKIEWTDHTFNPWEGCQKVGPGCDHCYAETRNARFAGGMAINWGPGAPRRRTSIANWRKPLAWDRAHAEFFAVHGRRQRVFCASLADVFDNAVDDQWRADLFILIAETPNLDWLILTKRIGNVERMVPEACDLIEYPEGWRSLWGAGKWPANVWLGTTIVNQEEADRDIPKLLAVPAARRFLSIEPLLGHVDLAPMLDHRANVWNDTGVDWVIVGGESGPGARAMHPNWARDLRDQCQAAGVAMLFKQWGEWHPSAAHDPASHSHDVDTEAVHIDGSRERRPMETFALTGAPGWAGMCRIGKKAAGRLLDGVEHDSYPEIQS